MKWKLTFRFVTTIISVVIIVMLINIVAAIMIFFIRDNMAYENNKLWEFGPEVFVRKFDKYVLSNEHRVYVSNEGEKILDSTKTWIQVLDEDGREVYHYNRPENVPLKYTPFEIIQGYKYQGELNNVSPILIGKKNVGDTQYSYIIGFPREKIDKQIFIYSTDEIGSLIKNTGIIVLLIDSIIALFFGYLFSGRLTKPLGHIIRGVEKLGEGEYDIHYVPKGIYRDVYYNLNNLSYILKSNKNERKKIDQMRQEWIANISHDIKTPLSSITGYAEILSNDDYIFSNKEIRSYANIINEKSNYIKELVDDLNLTTKLKNKTSILNKKEINLVKLVRESIIDILNDTKYGGSHIDFVCEESVILKKVDDTLIKRVIYNLLYNALIHNDSKVEIEVKLIKNEKIHIFIKDKGKGISKKELEYVFDRYYRGTNTGERHKGSGLGMAIAKEIVKAHDGDIKINSILGEGTEIEIIL